MLITIKNFFVSFGFLNGFTLKTSILINFFGIITLVALATACSTKKDKFVNRSFHSVTTKYNVMYNGNLALETGLQELTMTPDNFWEVLPAERMQIIEPVFGQDSVPRNANFKRAEDKAVKAIEKHSMNIGGSEKNPQMDEAYLLLGKARYYDQRFIPALEAFNYILYKYPDSDRINEIKLWKEKTNIRLENNSLAIQNLLRLLQETELDERIIAEANAMLAQAYFNEEQYDNAIIYYEKAKELSEIHEEKARYTFILGQLLQKQGRDEEAASAFQKVIEMKRKSPRQYTIQSHINQAKLNATTTDSVVFLEKFRKLLKDRENRPYLDVLNHQMALYYDARENDKEAIKYYNQSLKKKTNDAYMVASNYRNIAEIYFYDARYSLAGKYYDSTLVNLDNRTREFRHIRRKRENLDDVIKYEAIAVANDSILSLVRMSENEREDFFKDYIEKIKEEDKKLKELEEISERQQYAHQGSVGSEDRNAMTRIGNRAAQEESVSLRRAPGTPPSGLPSSNSNFYFYNQNLVTTGKGEFRKKWGNRPLKDYWRLVNYTGNAAAVSESGFDEEGNIIEKDQDVLEPRFTVEFYTSQIPTDQAVIDSLQTERNFAYYQLGIIYKDKFREYELAQSKLEELLDSNPEERLILPAMYNLYKIYEALGLDKMASMKALITSKYPDSRYAQIINNPNDAIALEGSADLVYNSMFKIYEDRDYRRLLTEIEPLIDQFSGEEIISKLELLKANATGNMKGLEEYKKALNYVALTYPNSEEGKEAENLLRTNIPKLEKLDFGKESSNWKLIHKVSETADLTELDKKLQLFLENRPERSFKITTDSYTLNDNFIVIHNVRSEQEAKDLIVIFEEYKDYKIKEKFVAISSEDYKVVQIKKNFQEFLQKTNPTP